MIIAKTRTRSPVCHTPSSVQCGRAGDSSSTRAPVPRKGRHRGPVETTVTHLKGVNRWVCPPGRRRRAIERSRTYYLVLPRTRQLTDPASVQSSSLTHGQFVISRALADVSLTCYDQETTEAIDICLDPPLQIFGRRFGGSGAIRGWGCIELQPVSQTISGAIRIRPSPAGRESAPAGPDQPADHDAGKTVLSGIGRGIGAVPAPWAALDGDRPLT